MAELPWEVELLLMLQDNDYEDYASWVQVIKEQYEAGNMSEHEFSRFVGALKRVHEENEWELKQTKKIIHRADNPHIKPVT